jgi:hypothetical protein
MKLIPLTQGKFAMVDDDMIERLSRFKWCVQKNGKWKQWYAVSREPGGKRVYMHHVVMGCVTMIDHKDGDGLNNQRYNLRPATDSQNQANTGISSRNTSGFKGVTRHKNGWQVQIRHQGRRRYVCRSQDIIEAAKAYDRAARELFGEFAKTNFERIP